MSTEDAEREARALRAGLRDLMDGEHAGPAPVEEVIRRGRNRRRMAGAAAGVLTCAVLASVIGLGLGFNGSDGAATVGKPATAPSATAGPDSPSAALERRTVTPGRPAAGPAATAAEVGRAYPVDWSAHCGLQYLPFAGRMWQAGTVRATPQNLPGPQGPGSGPPVVPGYATLTGPDSLRFEAPGWLDRPVTLTPAPDAPGCA
ncbi:hypothetical protein DEJ50_13890 [Streptomyces venezuelae]|uniref:Uncharacterized protein n=1 Tax=Streptomyces venezuelae TaxID=54571 RepID=A0A5P2D3H9_STRVZ|nr:hypothetical protein [Streptomyces venezuelae]QES48747.1 hypothetical protein DEJ50_13890 [Streptomyces venezuelae]